jgi:type II secretory pathway pseudopilin PulG
MTIRMHSARTARRREAGTVLLLVLFMAAAMLIAALATLPRLIMQGRRQKEEEMAWRGNQYVRAIRLYYRKYGHFPRTVEDFSKNPGNLHFLRKEYKDPMNETDGSWRYIYVGPGGQLIGSLTRTMPIGVIPLQAAVPGALGSQPGAGSGSFFGQGSGPGVAGQPGAAQTPTGQPPPQGQPTNQPATPDTSAQNQGDLTPDQLPPPPEAPKQAIQGASTTDSTVFGGQLVGVGSKVDRKSIRFYKGYGKYREWEFIWDPTEEAAAAAGGLVPVAPGGQLPGGQQPTGTQPIITQPLITTPTNPPQ